MEKNFRSNWFHHPPPPGWGSDVCIKVKRERRLGKLFQQVFFVRTGVPPPPPSWRAEPCEIWTDVLSISRAAQLSIFNSTIGTLMPKGWGAKVTLALARCTAARYME